MTTEQESLVDRYVHEPAYQIVGKRLDRAQTAEEALVQAGLDFSVVKRPVKAVLPSGKMIDIPQKFATVSSTGNVLGVVGSRYEVVQPDQHFAFFDPIVSRKEAVYVSAGLAHNGTKLWLLCKMPSHMRVQHSDLVGKYILLAGSFDTSLAITAKICPIRFSCQNQLSFALRSAGDQVRVKHTLNVKERLAEASRLLGISGKIFDQLEVVYNRLALRKVSERELQQFVNRLIPDNPRAESNARTKTIRHTMCDLAESGVGSNLNRMTAWSCLQGATEWVDHCLSSHNPEKRFNTIIFGGGEILKKKAFTLATGLFLN